MNEHKMLRHTYYYILNLNILIWRQQIYKYAPMESKFIGKVLSREQKNFKLSLDLKDIPHCSSEKERQMEVMRQHVEAILMLTLQTKNLKDQIVPNWKDTNPKMKFNPAVADLLLWASKVFDQRKSQEQPLKYLVPIDKESQFKICINKLLQDKDKDKDKGPLRLEETHYLLCSGFKTYFSPHSYQTVRIFKQEIPDDRVDLLIEQCLDNNGMPTGVYYYSIRQTQTDQIRDSTVNALSTELEKKLIPTKTQINVIQPDYWDAEPKGSDEEDDEQQQEPPKVRGHQFGAKYSQHIRVKQSHWKEKEVEKLNPEAVVRTREPAMKFSKVELQFYLVHQEPRNYVKEKLEYQPKTPSKFPTVFYFPETYEKSNFFKIIDQQ